MVPHVDEVVRAYIVGELLGGQPPEELVGTTYLIEEQIIDSLGIVSMVSFLEERFAITIESEDVILDNFETLDAISAFVESKLRSGSPR